MNCRASFKINKYAEYEILSLTDTELIGRKNFAPKLGSLPLIIFRFSLALNL